MHSVGVRPIRWSGAHGVAAPWLDRAPPHPVQAPRVHFCPHPHAWLPLPALDKWPWSVGWQQADHVPSGARLLGWASRVPRSLLASRRRLQQRGNRVTPVRCTGGTVRSSGLPSWRRDPGRGASPGLCLGDVQLRIQDRLLSGGRAAPHPGSPAVGGKHTGRKQPIPELLVSVNSGKTNSSAGMGRFLRELEGCR